MAWHGHRPALRIVFAEARPEANSTGKGDNTSHRVNDTRASEIYGSVT